MKNVYVLLLSVNFVFTLISMILAIFIYDITPNQEKFLFEYSAYNSDFQFTLLGYLLYSLVWLISLIGLYKYNFYARRLYLFLILSSFIVIYFSGWNVSPPIIGIIDQVISLTDGIIISLVFFSSLSNKFVKIDSSSIEN